LMNDLKIVVQQSFRKANEEVENAIVVPVKTSNHLVGHAIDINIEYDGKLYNSKLLKNYELLPERIKIFIIGCRISKIRWGGDLKISDSVHFDDNLYEIDRKKYEELLRLFQSN
ncbi:MAG: M15 family metallopeptidase, partial [Spirochaetes bacterium]|nr:M15 family metallopeptidase [Spirochaetota bacterium]